MEDNTSFSASTPCSFTFRCQTRVWDMWERILPRIAYAEFGMSTDTLIDDGVAFCSYCLGEYKDLPKEGKPYLFPRILWNAMTGFYDLDVFVTEVSEHIDDLIRNRRIHQLYMEHFLAARGIEHPKDARPFGVNKNLMGDERLETTPIYSNILDAVKHPLQAQMSLATLRYDMKCAGILPIIPDELSDIRKGDSEDSRLGNYLNKEVTMTLTQQTFEDLSPYLDIFKITPNQALPIILSQLQYFIPVTTGCYSDSFRADLFLRYLACKTLCWRWVEQIAIFETLAVESEAYSRIIAERLSVLNSEMESGQSLPEFMAEELTAREDPATDYSQATELRSHERVGGRNML